MQNSAELVEITSEVMDKAATAKITLSHEPVEIGDGIIVKGR